MGPRIISFLIFYKTFHYNFFYRELFCLACLIFLANFRTFKKERSPCTVADVPLCQISDTFASKISAVNDKTADNSIGNVTGSNAVNVFLGIGIAWTLAAVYHAYHGIIFVVNPGTYVFVLCLYGNIILSKFLCFLHCCSLAFSLSMFLGAAIVAIAILLARRSKKIGGELGGPVGYKYATSAIFTSLWVIYITVSTLEAYGFIEGF